MQEKMGYVCLSEIAAELLLEPNWQECITLAVVWAHRDHIAYTVGGDTFRAFLPTADHLRRKHLNHKSDFVDVKTSELELCHSLNLDSETGNGMPQWICFTNPSRYPRVGGVIPLTPAMGELFTHHELAWTPADGKNTALEGIRLFLLQDLPKGAASKVIEVIRPLLASYIPSDRSRMEQDASDEEKEDSADEMVSSSVAKLKRQDASTASSSSQPASSLQWNPLIQRRMEELAETVSSFEDFRTRVKSLIADSPDYAAAITSMVNKSENPDSQTLAQHLREERLRMCNFLEPAAKYFGVCRRKVYRYLYSCESVACRNLKRNDSISGIFLPETHADILAALMKHTYHKTDCTLQALRDTLPESLVKAREPKPGKPKAKPDKTGPSNKRKILREYIAKARQLLVRDEEDQEKYIVAWVTKRELVEDHGQEEAEKTWKTILCSTEKKVLAEFGNPTTQAYAFASWRNKGIPLANCYERWRSIPKSSLPAERIDEASRVRVRAKLQKILKLDEE